MNGRPMKAIVNAKVVHERGIIWDGVILISGKTITAYGKRPETEIPENAEIIDAKGDYVGPGFVDIHVHGGGGHQTSLEPTQAAEFFLSHGETSMLCTPSGIGSKTREEIVGFIKNIREAKKTAKNIKGIYMEGPYYNPRYGANSKLNTWGHRPVDPDDVHALVDACGEDVRVWMVAPERAGEGLGYFLEYARKINPKVKFAVGHSEALPGEIRAMGKYRPTIQTHSMNATGRVGEPKGGLRCFGPDEYCFKEPDVYCELISDSLGIHVDSEMQELLIHTKGVGKVVLITDSTVYNNPTPDKYANATDLNFDPFGGIAGSKLTMDKACRNIMSHTNCGIAQAFLMASTNPAKAVGLYDELGSVDLGKRADLVFVDDVFNVSRVMLEGEFVEKINM